MADVGVFKKPVAISAIPFAATGGAKITLHWSDSKSDQLTELKKVKKLFNLTFLSNKLHAYLK